MILLIREEITEDSVVVTAVVNCMEQAKMWMVDVCGGKTSPFCRGSGKVGLDAFPTIFPIPGKTVAGTVWMIADAKLIKSFKKSIYH